MRQYIDYIIAACLIVVGVAAIRIFGYEYPIMEVIGLTLCACGSGLMLIGGLKRIRLALRLRREGK